MARPRTRNQQMAERAYTAVSKANRTREYTSFAKSFPALIQTAGLCQAVAFAMAKGKETGPQSRVLGAVIYTLGLPGIENERSLADKSRNKNVITYMRMSRMAMQAATWVKRYVEALPEADDHIDPKGTNTAGNRA